MTFTTNKHEVCQDIEITVVNSINLVLVCAGFFFFFLNRNIITSVWSCGLMAAYRKMLSKLSEDVPSFTSTHIARNTTSGSLESITFCFKVG